MATAAEKKSNPASPGAADDNGRLAWELALHEERMMNQRSNLFLVSESMMLAAYISGWDRLPQDALFAVAVLGILISVIWALINGRQHRDMRVAVIATHHLMPEFTGIQTALKSGIYAGKSFEKYTGLRVLNRDWSLYIFLYGLPVILGALWGYLFFLVFTRGPDTADFLSYPPLM